MACVKDFYIGNTHIKICDDYCKDKTEEEVEAILKRIARIAMNAYIGQEIVKEKENTILP